MEHQYQEQDNNLKNIIINKHLYNNNNTNNNSSNSGINLNENSIMIESGLNYYQKSNKQEDMLPSKGQINQQMDAKLSEDNLNDINNSILESDDLPTAAVLLNNENNYSTSSELIIPLIDQDNQELGAIATSPTNSSLHNSTDNLSYTPDNNFNVDDLVLFQNNISDDDDDEHDSIRSDNCVYAYRGGVDNDVNQFVMNLHHHNQYNQENDDETDFLEMDFDPDPLSEIEPQNFKDNHIDELHQNEYFRNEIRLNEIQKCQKDFLQINRNLKLSPKESNTSCNINNEINLNSDDDYELKSKLTGAKPKKVPIDLNKLSDNTKSRKHNFSQQKSLDSSVDILLLNDDNKKKTSINFHDLLNKDVNDEMCLDCLEKEFLFKTVGTSTSSPEKQCMKCKIKTNSKSMLVNKAQCDYIFPTLNENHDYKFYSNELNKSMNSTESPSICLSQRRSSCTTFSADLLNLKLNKENFRFSTSNVNAMLLVQALERIKVEYDETIIRNHFENERKLFNDVYELILYKSKNNSNYKKLIKLLKLASKEKLVINIENEISDTKFHTVQISVNDIITCWDRNNDLSKLKTLDKRFAEMNVLGKIVNLIRKKQQKSLKLSEYILVPQYYRNRNIIISKNYIN